MQDGALRAHTVLVGRNQRGEWWEAAVPGVGQPRRGHGACEAQLQFGALGSPGKRSGQAGHCLFVCCVLFFRELWKVQTTKVSAANRVKLCGESQNAKSDQIRATH